MFTYENSTRDARVAGESHQIAQAMEKAAQTGYGGDALEVVRSAWRQTVVANNGDQSAAISEWRDLRQRANAEAGRNELSTGLPLVLLQDDSANTRSGLSRPSGLMWESQDQRLSSSAQDSLYRPNDYNNSLNRSTDYNNRGLELNNRSNQNGFNQNELNAAISYVIQRMLSDPRFLAELRALSGSANVGNASIGNSCRGNSCGGGECSCSSCCGGSSNYGNRGYGGYAGNGSSCFGSSCYSGNRGYYSNPGYASSCYSGNRGYSSSCYSSNRGYYSNPGYTSSCYSGSNVYSSCRM